jgi:threonine dehydratase
MAPIAAVAVGPRPGRLERVEGAVALREIEAARARIATTPLRPSASLSRRTGHPVHLKETQQKTGSFKLRGGLNAVLCLPEQDRAKGLVTASSGNHRRAVAYAAREAGVRASMARGAAMHANLAARRPVDTEVHRDIVADRWPRKAVA